MEVCGFGFGPEGTRGSGRTDEPAQGEDLDPGQRPSCPTPKGEVGYSLHQSVDGFPQPLITG
jgi:hypothetical protein